MSNIFSNIRSGRLLKYNSIEHPVVFQLGGSNPTKLAKATSICSSLGYDEINLNCGCPSPYAKEDSFGAVLMKNPNTVADIVKEMIEASNGVPVTVKCRLGVDDNDSYDELKKFIETVSTAGIKHFIIHARKALLKGLNHKENRNIPPLKYDWVYNLAKDYPGVKFSLNGGLQSIEQMKEVMSEDKKLEGCMIGRLAYNDPWIMGKIDKEIYGQVGLDLSKREVILKYAEYIGKEDVCNSVAIKPLSFIFAGEKNSGVYRRFLADNVREVKYKNDPKLLIEDAIDIFSQFNATAANRTHD